MRIKPRYAIVTGLIFVLTSLALAALDADRRYELMSSPVITDLHGNILSIQPNVTGQYALTTSAYPHSLQKLVITKEDRFFWYHPGINPVSIARALWNYGVNGTIGGSSTITQQLAKNLLGNVDSRTFSNKLIELYYTLAMEITLSKEEILTRYMNTAFLGSGAQGFASGAQRYFNSAPADLSASQELALAASLSRPSTDNPQTRAGVNRAHALGNILGVTSKEGRVASLQPWTVSPAAFELSGLSLPCHKICETTIDSELTETLRAILRDNLALMRSEGAETGAIVIIRVPDNKLLAIVGSPNPASRQSGAQINMALEPRPIGSTVKPFIYLKGFELGLRPYTTVEDREYKYAIGTGFPLYPRNYDGQYRGMVTLHESLASSLNVPTVKTLEYVGLDTFYDFLEQDLAFTPLQNLTEYELGIALGGLEMDLLTLTSLFTAFPNRGLLKPVRILEDANAPPLELPMSALSASRQIVETPYVELINTVLGDRYAGVEQFGLAGNLNLPITNYAVKTGTSRDYHDSWTIGYTPDLVVGVWIGRADNNPLSGVSGSIGAGRVWNEVMSYLAESPYYSDTPFPTESVVPISTSGGLSYGLEGDDVMRQTNLMLGDTVLILQPHDGDRIRLQPDTIITLRSHEAVDWYVEGLHVGHGEIVNYSPKQAGDMTIKAQGSGHEERVTIYLVTE
jgi:membrane carboxypeptidase/penicillin-binding protein PbpC